MPQGITLQLSNFIMCKKCGVWLVIDWIQLPRFNHFDGFLHPTFNIG